MANLLQKPLVMMMMDTHSTNVCLIGILYILFYLSFAVNPLRIALSGLPGLGFATKLAIGLYFVLMAALAALMIRGVIRKQHKLLLPFLTTITSFLIFAIGVFFKKFILGFGSPFYYYEEFCYIIGGTTISIYTIYTLYCKLRCQNIKENPMTDFSNEENKKAVNAVEDQLFV